jgi:hydroxylamine dehydrogenase
MSENKSPLRTARALVIGLAAVIVVLGAALIVMAIGRSGTQVPLEQIDVLANSNDQCVVCHRRTTPGIVEQYGHSRMAAANVSCEQCHVVQADYPAAEEHEGSYILPSPTTAICQNCHGVEVAQFYQSRHSLPAYVAFAGSKDLSPKLLAMYQAIPEGTFNPDSSRNAIAELEGTDMTPFTCANCHSIGAPAADDSVGECQKCHLRHEFSREQARKPETCNACHIGPDHPQYEIYTESPHGIAYHTLGQNWHWDAAPGTLTVNDFPAPTCAICHMSGFGPSGTTHDVGDRLTWFLFAPISERRPNWQDNKVRMQGVCMACHNKNFIDDFYTAADTATDRVNAWVKESDAMVAPLKDQGLLTAAPFDEPIDYTYFELWHHWGRTAKFGTWMQGPDYAQWHGAYEVLKALAELKTQVEEKMAAPAAGTGQ